jgi:hypothetical protein
MSEDDALHSEAESRTLGNVDLKAGITHIGRNPQTESDKLKIGLQKWPVDRLSRDAVEIDNYPVAKVFSLTQLSPHNHVSVMSERGNLHDLVPSELQRFRWEQVKYIDIFDSYGNAILRLHKTSRVDPDHPETTIYGVNIEETAPETPPPLHQNPIPAELSRPSKPTNIGREIPIADSETTHHTGENVEIPEGLTLAGRNPQRPSTAASRRANEFTEGTPDDPNLLKIELTKHAPELLSRAVFALESKPVTGELTLNRTSGNNGIRVHMEKGKPYDLALSQPETFLWDNLVAVDIYNVNNFNLITLRKTSGYGFYLDEPDP